MGNQTCIIDGTKVDVVIKRILLELTPMQDNDFLHGAIERSCADIWVADVSRSVRILGGIDLELITVLHDYFFDLPMNQL